MLRLSHLAAFITLLSLVGCADDRAANPVLPPPQPFRCNGEVADDSQIYLAIDGQSGGVDISGWRLADFDGYAQSVATIDLGTPVESLDGVQVDADPRLFDVSNVQTALVPAGQLGHLWITDGLLPSGLYPVDRPSEWLLAHSEASARAAAGAAPEDESTSESTLAVQVKHVELPVSFEELNAQYPEEKSWELWLYLPFRSGPIDESQAYWIRSVSATVTDTVSDACTYALWEWPAYCGSQPSSECDPPTFKSRPVAFCGGDLQGDPGREECERQMRQAFPGESGWFPPPLPPLTSTTAVLTSTSSPARAP